ncbi:MAG: hypothetical protein HRT45_16465 [Bdellovibrionales bacterium]|nr:hypothetical protein [Bdellovibrionales bacterium]
MKTIIFILLLPLFALAEKEPVSLYTAPSEKPACDSALGGGLPGDSRGTKNVEVTISIRLGLFTEPRRIDSLHVALERKADRFGFSFTWVASGRSAVLTLLGEESIVTHFADQYESAFYSGGWTVFDPSE